MHRQEDIPLDGSDDTVYLLLSKHDTENVISNSFETLIN